MPSDIPAAHSMDTRWFAVDLDGRVGRFETGERGALPWAAESRDFDEWPLSALAAAPAAASGQLAAGIEPQPLGPGHALIVLTDHPGARESLGWLAADLEAASPSYPSVLATQTPLSPALFRRLSAHVHVAKIVPQGELSCWLEGDQSPIFQFRRDDPAPPGAYRRINRPSAPLKVTALPDPATSVIARVSLPLRFADTRALHLADHLREEDCHTWMGLALRG